MLDPKNQRMEFSSFTFILTNECNFNCSYCYQKKGDRYIDVPSVENAIDFFYPFFEYKCYINFTGGEPLLAFKQIEQAVDYLQVKNRTLNKQIHYYVTTNGSLINDDILQFLDRYNFSLILSFDGLAQEICRKKGSFKQIVSIIEKLLNSTEINFETNSVFTPSTVGYLSKSIQFIIELGVPNITFALSKIPSWSSSSLLQLKKELALLKEFILSFYKRTGTIPFAGFRRKPGRGIFDCTAAKDC